MRNIIYTNRKIFLAISAILAIVFLALAGTTVFSARAQVDDKIVLPISTEEVLDLDNHTPKDAVAFDGGYAVIRDNELWIYNGSNYSRCPLKEGLPNQIKLLSGDKLVVLDKNHLYIVNPFSLTYTAIAYKGTDITASFFDLSGDYLVTKSGSDVFLYTLNSQGQISSYIPKTDISAKNDAYIAVSNDGVIYYVADNGFLYKHDTESTLVLQTATISNIVTHGNYVYYIADNKINRTSLADNATVTMVLDGDEKHDLGNLEKPTSLSFNKDNLLVSDPEIGAVQEFEVDNDKLIFNGFAIGKNKTAFNRSGENVVDVERYKDRVAILTDEKVMTYKEGFSEYDKDNFTNLFAEDLGGTMPKSFALGNGVVILATDNEVRTYKLNAKSDNLSNAVTFTCAIKDVCYQSGYFYVLATGTTTAKVYKFPENALPNTDELESRLFKTYNNPNLSKLTVTVFGEEFVSEDSTIIKLCSDLNGDVYAIKQNGFFKYNGASSTFVLAQSTSRTLTSFTLNFDEKKVYYTYQNSEILHSTENVGNLAIGGTAVPNDLVFTGDSANTNLTFYTAKENSNVYLVDIKDQTFAFNKLSNVEDCYLLLHKLPQLNHFVLAGQNGIVLISQNNLTVFNNPIENESKTVYTATDVNGYYIPIISQNNTYTLTYAENKVRIPKSTTIAVSGRLSFLNRSFYLATFTVGANEFTGYVPVEFTTEKLSEHYTFKTFIVKSVKGASVYADHNSTTSLTTLSKGEKVRVYHTEGDICQIKFLRDGVWTDGYINANDLETPAKIAVRNVLIIVSIAVCLCSVSLFFILKKKRS